MVCSNHPATTMVPFERGIMLVIRSPLAPPAVASQPEVFSALVDITGSSDERLNSTSFDSGTVEQPISTANNTA